MFRQKPWLWATVGLLFWAVLLGVWAWSSELNGTECYLAYAAERLDWGYVDHGLLSPAWAAAGQALAGATTLGVRLFFVLLQLGALGLFYTVVRRGVPPDREATAAWAYVLVAFSQPLLQLYGLMASDETTLFCGVALLLWAVDGTVRSKSAWWTLAVGAAWAWVGSTTLYGIFPMTAVLIAFFWTRPRRAGDWRLWVGVLIGSALLVPTLMWQLEHGWPVADHFFERGDTKGLFGALAAWFIVFNPLWIVPGAVLAATKLRRPMAAMETVCRTLLFAVTGAMVAAGMLGAPSGVWAMPAVLPLLYLLPRWAVRRPIGRRYVLFAGGVGSLVVAFFVGVLIATPPLHRYLGMERNAERSRAWVDTLKSRGVERVVLEGDPLGASVLRRYSDLDAVALASVYSAPNQYTERVDFAKWTHRAVAVELRSDTVDGLVVLDLSAPRRRVPLLVQADFVPVYGMRVEVETVPTKVLTGSRIALLLWVTNPYDEERVIGGREPLGIAMHLKSTATGAVVDVPMPIKAQTVAPHQRAMVPSTVQIPTVATGDYELSFSVVRAPFSSRSNVEMRPIRIVNPKSKI